MSELYRLSSNYEAQRSAYSADEIREMRERAAFGMHNACAFMGALPRIEPETPLKRIKGWIARKVRDMKRSGG